MAMASNKRHEVRVVKNNIENLTSERGELLPIDQSALLHQILSRSVLAQDWTNYHEYTSLEVRAPDDAPEEVIEAVKTIQAFALKEPQIPNKKWRMRKETNQQRTTIVHRNMLSS